MQQQPRQKHGCVVRQGIFMVSSARVIPQALQQHDAAALLRAHGRDVLHRRLVPQQALVHVQHMFHHHQIT
jgi:hypothetical protein